MAHERTTRPIHLAVLATALMIPTLAACGSDDPKQSIALTAPATGASVAGGVTVAMTAKGLTVEPAGDVHEDAGHFHVIVDAGCVAEGSAIPSDAQHVHFGKAQTEGTIYLGPGEHELCLQLGDGAHVATGFTDSVTVNVGITDTSQFCAVVSEVDELFDSVNEVDDFALVQAAYSKASPLLDQLDDGIETVDADVRGDVTEVIGFGRGFVDIITTAADMAAAEEAAAPYWSGEITVSEVGAAWVLDECGIDLNA